MASAVGENQPNANTALAASLSALQQKLANERERLNRPSSESSSNNDETNIKLQQAMLRRQELLDRIRNEQLVDAERPRTYSPRRRYTPSPLPPPSRRSLPDLSRAYHFNWFNKPEPQVITVPKADMAQTKHVIEHQFKHVDPPTQRPVVLPPIQQVQPAVQTYQAPPAVHTVQAPAPIHIPAPAPTIVQAPQPQIAIAQPQPVIQQMPSYTLLDGGYKTKDTMFNKSDFMDMMMLQNAQMHHMVMQQMMLQNLPGGCGGGSCKLPTAQVPLAPVMAEATAVRAAPVAYSSPPVVHHYQSMPAMEMRGPPMGRAYNSNLTFYDDGSNYFTYH